MSGVFMSYIKILFSFTILFLFISIFCCGYTQNGKFETLEKAYWKAAVPLNENHFKNHQELKNININVEHIGNMLEPRSYMQAVKLKNGNILILGGIKHEDISPPNKYHMIGIKFKNTVLKSAEIYDVKANKNIKVSDMKHSECVALYVNDDGNVILLSKNKPCQLFNVKNNTFTEIYPGIKDLPENPYIITESKEEILILSKEMNQIIKMNIKTGEYSLLYKGENNFVASIPINKNIILCAGKIEKANNNKTNNNIYLYDITKNKFTKIGLFNDNNYNYNILKINEEKFLRVSVGKPIYNYIFTIKNNHIRSDLLNINSNISNIYKLSDNLFYLHPLIIFEDTNNYIDMRLDKNRKYYYLFSLTGFGKSKIELDNSAILFMGGNVTPNISSSNKIYKLSIVEN